MSPSPALSVIRQSACPPAFGREHRPDHRRFHAAAPRDPDPEDSPPEDDPPKDDPPEEAPFPNDMPTEMPPDDDPPWDIPEEMGP